MTLRSLRTSALTDGRCTLTTTSSPERSVAACTCAIDAAARGVVSNDVKMSSRGAPRSASTVRRTSSHVSGGTLSRHSLNCCTSSAGNRPSPLEMICPSLMYVGPSASAARRRRSEMSALLASGEPNRWSFLRTTHGRRALPNRPATVTTRTPGGMRDSWVSRGTSLIAARRNRAARLSQAMLSRSSTHGPASVNAPQF